jgi:hypothetical protein
MEGTRQELFAGKTVAGRTRNIRAVEKCERKHREEIC